MKRELERLHDLGWAHSRVHKRIGDALCVAAGPCPDGCLLASVRVVHLCDVTGLRAPSVIGHLMGLERASQAVTVRLHPGGVAVVRIDVRALGEDHRARSAHLAQLRARRRAQARRGRTTSPLDDAPDDYTPSMIGAAL